MTKLLTRAELAHGRKLIEAAFTGPWRYNQWNIECPACEGGTTSPEGVEDGSCTHPNCDGTEVPATFVEAPHQYPEDEERPQIVAMIEVPGIDDLAQANGECICWLRNQATALLDAHEELLDWKEAVEFIELFGEPRPVVWVPHKPGELVAYAKSLGWTRGVVPGHQ